ncbi:MAG: hypothetical protein ACRD1X_21555 [Vicinamibacteria bacterium]
MRGSDQPNAWTLAENTLALVVLAAMSIMPRVEILGRTTLGGGVPGSIPLVQHLTRWITFVGALLPRARIRCSLSPPRAFCLMGSAAGFEF